MTYLISAESLADEGADCIFDCSFSLADAQAGRAQFQQGHIPGAVYVDLNRDLSEPPDHRGRHPMPDRLTFTQRVRALGVVWAGHPCGPASKMRVPLSMGALKPSCVAKVVSGATE